MFKFDINRYYVFTILVIAAGGIPKGMNLNPVLMFSKENFNVCRL